MFHVITTMNQKIYNETGETMISSFLENWPNNIKMSIYFENPILFKKEHANNERLIFIDQLQTQPELTNFINRHKNREDQKNPLELNKGAIRFSYKSFAIFNHCIERGNEKYVIWLDADTYTYRPITEKFLSLLVHPHVYVTYLGRDNNYSECGFVIYNNHHRSNYNFMKEWKEIYITDKIFELPQWHDSYIFDVLRKRFLLVDEQKNLTPYGKNYDHVFIQSCLGNFIDHMKGNRKLKGKSNISDLSGKGGQFIKEYLSQGK